MSSITIWRGEEQLARSEAPGEVALFYPGVYRDGDRIEFTCDSRRAVVQVDQAVQPARVFLPGSGFTYRPPLTGDGLAVYAPGAFQGEGHVLAIRPVDRNVPGPKGRASGAGQIGRDHDRRNGRAILGTATGTTGGRAVAGVCRLIPLLRKQKQDHARNYKDQAMRQTKQAQDHKNNSAYFHFTLLCRMLSNCADYFSITKLL